VELRISTKLSPDETVYHISDEEFLDPLMIKAVSSVDFDPDTAQVRNVFYVTENLNGYERPYNEKSLITSPHRVTYSTSSYDTRPIEDI